MFSKSFIFVFFMLCSVQGTYVILKEKKEQQLVECSNPSLLKLQIMLYEAEEAEFIRLVDEKNNMVREKRIILSVYQNKESLVLCPTNVTLENNPERYPFELKKKVCACKNCRFGIPAELYECAPVMNEMVVLKRSACLEKRVFEWKPSKANVTIHCGCRRKSEV